jgi:hypothetical protein
MNNSGENYRFNKKSNHRKHRSLAALDTSNPNYKIISPTRKKPTPKLNTTDRSQKVDVKSYIKPKTHYYTFDKMDTENRESLYTVPSGMYSYDPCVSLKGIVLFVFIL